LAIYLFISYSASSRISIWPNTSTQNIPIGLASFSHHGDGQHQGPAGKWLKPGKTKQSKLALSGTASSSLSPIPIIIFAFNRADNLRRTIESVLATVPGPPTLHPIFVSQDGDDVEVAQVIASYAPRIAHLRYHWPGIPGRTLRTSYLKIAGHYNFALTEVMDHVDGHEQWDRVIMLEDDFLLAPDAFSYFRRMSPLFDTDPTLYCVSAWNENGQTPFVSSTTAVYRTDCFPGLGWMWSRAIWNELREWTPGYWDDWLREPAQRRGRTCIYPEINRVYTFGETGASNGRFFNIWFKDIRLNNEHVDWTTVDVDRLQPSNYDAWLSDRLLAAEHVDDVHTAKAAIDTELMIWSNATGRVSEKAIPYTDLEDLTSVMEPLGLMYDHKAGIPRTSYRGIVPFRYREVRIWIVPDNIHLPLG